MIEDLTDGENWWDVQKSTGISEERAKEIIALCDEYRELKNGRG